jgi:hypothetical protein
MKALCLHEVLADHRWSNTKQIVEGHCKSGVVPLTQY